MSRNASNCSMRVSRLPRSCPLLYSPIQARKRPVNVAVLQYTVLQGHQVICSGPVRGLNNDLCVRHTDGPKGAFGESHRRVDKLWTMHAYNVDCERVIETKPKEARMRTRAPRLR